MKRPAKEKKSIRNPAQRVESKIQNEMYGAKILTFISECPECGEPKRWSTMGLIADLKCDKCGTIYRMFEE